MQLSALITKLELPRTISPISANKIDPTDGYGEVIMTTSYSVEQCPTHMKGEYYSLHILCAPSPIKKFCKFRITKNRRIIMSLTRRQMKSILSKKIGEQLSQENGEHLSSPIKKVRITKNGRIIMSPRRQMRSILSRRMGRNSRRRMGSNSRNYLNRDWAAARSTSSRNTSICKSYRSVGECYIL